VVVEDGRVRSGPPADMLVDAPVAPPLVELGRVAGWRPLPLTVRDARRRTGSLGLTAPPAPIPARATPGGATGSTPALAARDVVVSHGRAPAVREVSLEVAPGAVVA